MAGKAGPEWSVAPRVWPHLGLEECCVDVGVLDGLGFEPCWTSCWRCDLRQERLPWGLSFLSCKMGSMIPLKGFQKTELLSWML